MYTISELDRKLQTINDQVSSKLIVEEQQYHVSFMAKKMMKISHESLAGAPFSENT